MLGGCPNVVLQVGEEFTGPVEFVRFWLDTVAGWQRDTGKSVLVGLSCTKDVQDTILADPGRAAVVSVIDIKYWWYTPDGGVYDPKSGDLAPRQQLREWKGNRSRSAESVARAVREWRGRFPDKAVTVVLAGADGRAVLAAGGSVPQLPATTDPALHAAAARMRPVGDGYVLADPGRDYLASAPAGPVRIDLTGQAGSFSVGRVNLATGRVVRDAELVRGGGVVELARGPAAAWLVRQ